MKIKKRKFFLLIFFLLNLSYSTAQSSFQKETYEAFLKNNISTWKKLTEKTENDFNTNSINDNLKILHCYYVYTSVLLDKKQYDTAEDIISKANKRIEKLLKQYPNNAEILNYKGVFISYQIPNHKFKAIFLGKQSIKYIKKALKLEANNPQILFDNGNAYYYPPKIFGGDKEEALRYYTKAIQIIEKNKETSHSWIYLQMLMLQARCNELLGNLYNSKKIYEKVLKIEPRFTVVKNKLYPNLIRKINKK